MRDLDLVLGAYHIRLGIFLLLVDILFPGIYGALESVHHSSYEIIIPRKLTFRDKEDSKAKLSYALLMKEKRQIIHLKLKKRLFVKNFPVYTYSKSVPSLDMPFIPDNCHYDGYIEGELGSIVSVSTCSGLRGIMTIQKTVYGIEPIETSRQFEHILYRMDGPLHSSCRMAAEEDQRFRSSVQKQRKEEKETLETEALNYMWSHTKYVEMFVVVDNRRFQMWNSNVTRTVQVVVDALAHVNTYSQGIHVKVVLVGLEIWTERDQVRIAGDLREVLHNFNQWRQEKLVGRAKHDVAHLIVGYEPGEAMGEAFLNGACVSELAAAVDSFYHEDPALFALLMVHELGHNLAVHLDAPRAITPGAKSEIHEIGSEAPLLSFGPTIEGGIADDINSPECSSNQVYKKVPAITVVLSALIVNVVLLMALLSIIFVLFFYQNIPWSTEDDIECTEICEAQVKKNLPPP
ncbi:disintegrin and metalloproteinase domain-containing protein 1b-like [Petaurus breviceps papuanus]|uniref:disintegrin and metalloproteinase domain-containing protein 1b-like n=1 Tax=Petaurus breviceps papuanus TaxID=3040969 RepID=UPI0036D89622